MTEFGEWWVRGILGTLGERVAYQNQLHGTHLTTGQRAGLLACQNHEIAVGIAEPQLAVPGVRIEVHSGHDGVAIAEKVRCTIDFVDEEPERHTVAERYADLADCFVVVPLVQKVKL